MNVFLYRILNRLGLLCGRQKKSITCVLFILGVTYLIFLILEDSNVDTLSIEQLDVETFNLHVVEEHHEVLPLWFGIANRGKMSHQGNVLLHIDGHSDDAPPRMIPGYKPYKWPVNPKEIKLMMQSNDVFVTAAAMVGMFKRVIWVWPKWDEVNHDQPSEKHLIFFGERIEKDKSNLQEKSFCVCEDVKNGIKGVCYGENATADELVSPEKDDYKIPSEECELVSEVKPVLFEEIREDVVLKEIKSGSLIHEDESLVVDIDEDFFGCESGAKYLESAGVIWRNVEKLDSTLSSLICPLSTHHEAQANELFSNLVKEALNKCKGDKSRTNCKHIFQGFQKYVQKEIKTAMLTSKFFCKRNMNSLNSLIKKFVSRLLVLNHKQLSALLKTGFCLETTPKAQDFKTDTRASGYFYVCHGFNVPNNTVVLYHTPTEREVTQRQALLRGILTLGEATPKIVTLCRSMRDGYNPREYFDTIENGIIKHFKERYKNVNVQYDKDLLGGIKGWPRKH